MNGHERKDKNENKNMREKVGATRVGEKITKTHLRWLGHVRWLTDSPARKLDQFEDTAMKRVEKDQ